MNQQMIRPRTHNVGRVIVDRLGRQNPKDKFKVEPPSVLGSTLWSPKEKHKFQVIDATDETDITPLCILPQD